MPRIAKRVIILVLQAVKYPFRFNAVVVFHDTACTAGNLIGHSASSSTNNVIL